MKSLVKKVEDSGNKQIMLTDRGVSFGYNNLVSDFNKHQFKLYDFTLFSASDIKKIISCGSVDCVKQVIGDYTSGALINGIK